MAPLVKGSSLAGSTISGTGSDVVAAGASSALAGVSLATDLPFLSICLGLGAHFFNNLTIPWPSLCFSGVAGAGSADVSAAGAEPSPVVVAGASSVATGSAFSRLAATTTGSLARMAASGATAGSVTTGFVSTTGASAGAASTALVSAGFSTTGSDIVWRTRVLQGINRRSFVSSEKLGSRKVFLDMSAKVAEDVG